MLNSDVHYLARVGLLANEVDVCELVRRLLWSEASRTRTDRLESFLLQGLHELGIVGARLLMPRGFYIAQKLDVGRFGHLRRRGLDLGVEQPVPLAVNNLLVEVQSVHLLHLLLLLYSNLSVLRADVWR